MVSPSCPASPARTGTPWAPGRPANPAEPRHTAQPCPRTASSCQCRGTSGDRLGWPPPCAGGSNPGPTATIQ